MNNYDRINGSYYKLLANEHDAMYRHMNDPYFLNSMTNERFLKFVEFRKSCNIPINSIEEKEAFMIQFNQFLEKNNRKKQIESLKNERANLIELAKRRYEALPFFTRLKQPNPKKINFDSLSDSQIEELYSGIDNKKR